MEPGKIAKQMVTFQKTLFENSFKAMVMIQDQTEKIVDTYVSQLPWVTEDGKKTLEESKKFYLKSREDFKKAVDDGFSRLDEMFTQK
jgi:hypothetical protein